MEYDIMPKYCVINGLEFNFGELAILQLTNFYKKEKRACMQ